MNLRINLLRKNSRLCSSVIKNNQYFFGYVISIQIIIRKTREITRGGSSSTAK